MKKYEKRHHFTRGTRGSGGRPGSSSSLFYDPLEPMLQEHEGILEVEPFEHEPDCLLPFDTESATNEVPLRLEKPRAQCAVNAWPINDAARDPIEWGAFRRALRLSANAA